MTEAKPTVFIGSSTERATVLNVVARLLKPHAQVTRWTDTDKFAQIGEYFLDSLIAASGHFDFAVLIFGPDDKVTTRKKNKKAPRDNVIFELGLFLSRLGRDRTFVIVPRVWRNNIKILSDLQGLNLAEYDPPKREEDLEASLRGICKHISGKIRGRPRLVQRGPRRVIDVSGPINELVRDARALKRHVDIRNIALDMEVTWPMVRDTILAAEDASEITWQGLMIDRRAKLIQNHSSGTVSTSVATDVEKKIEEFYKKNWVEIERRNIRFECRAYSTLPTMHGFLVNGTVLFLSMCGLKKGKLVGAPNPYIRLDSPRDLSSDEAATHFIGAFEDWFNYHWQTGRKVWPR